MPTEPRIYEAWLPPDTLSSRVKKLREASGLTQFELADHSGVSRALIAMLETKKCSVSLGRLNLLASAFNMTLSEMLAGVDLSEYER